ncbi:protein of unknown function [Pararobbsia alpina]
MEAKHMPRECAEVVPGRQFLRGVVGHPRFNIGARQRRHGRAVKTMVDIGEHPRVVIRLAAQHHAVDVLEMFFRFVERLDPAVDRDFERREIALELIRKLVLERRDLAILFRAQALEDGVARMHDKDIAARVGNRADKVAHKAVFADVVDPDAMLDRDRNRHNVTHRLDAVRNQFWLRHQASAKRAALNALGRTTAIEIDLVISPLLGKRRAFGKIGWLAATQLERDRMFLIVEVQVSGHVAVQQRTGGHHLGVQPGVPRNQAVKIPAMPVGPVHHRRNGNAPGAWPEG